MNLKRYWILSVSSLIDNVTEKTLWGYFIIIFSPFAVILTVLVVSAIHFSEKNHLKVIESRELGYLDAAAIIINQFYFEAISDLVVLSQIPSIKSLDERNIDQVAKVAETFQRAAMQYDRYDQIRYFDSNNREVIHIVSNKGYPTIVPFEQIQNSPLPHYYQKLLKLENDEIFVSQLDLTIEDKKILRPLKPTVRLGIPVLDWSGKKKGLLVFNTKADKLLSAFRDIMQKSSLHQGMLLNKNGYWLSNGKQENEWGFMFGRNDRKFGTDFPQEWSIISFNDHGKIQTDNGLFIYSTVYPFPELKPFVTKASALQNYLETKSGTTDGYYWKIVLFLPKTALVVDSFFKQRFGIAVLIIIYLLLGSASYFIAHAILKRKQFQERIIKSAADLNQAQKIARLGNWSFDISTNNFEWSQEIYRIFGVDQGKPMSYEGYLSLVYADDVKTVDDAWQITCQGEPHRIIFRTIADGNIKWLEQIAECGFDSNGNIKKIVGTLQDITAIKTTKEYLKRLFDEHKSLIQSIPAGVYKCKIDSSGEVRFEFVSQRFCEILGVREEDALCDFHMVFQGVIQDDQNSLLSAIENLSVSRDRFFWEGQIINNGASCWLRFESGEPYFLDNGDTILSGIVVDMTDHIMAERLDLLQSELLIAQELQASMLPAMPMFSKNREVEICAFLKPAKEISGDFYDAFWLDSRRICIAIGDVVGKGIPAAIYMVHVMTLLRTEILKNKDVLQSIHAINKSLSQDNPMCMFVTLTIGVLDITNGTYQYVNGGHLRPVLGNFRDGFQLIEAPEGMLVGITPQGGYEIAERKLKSGDMLILYTDGITEATNSGKKRFTEQRFLDHLNSQQKKQSVCGLTNGILGTVKAFTSTAEQSDDMTLLVLSYNKN